MAISYNPSSVTSGLVLCLDAANRKSYPTTGTTWTDLSGRGNNGALQNGVGYTGSNGGALVFDGTNTNCYVSNNTSLNTNTYTVEVWFKTQISNRRILVKESPSSITNYSMQIDSSGYFQCGVYDGTNNPSFSNTSKIAIDNNWHHGVFTRNNTVTNGLSIYFDNIIQQANDTTTTNTVTNTADLTIASRLNNTSVFGGYISLIRIYNRALSASEIQQNYNATKSRYGL